MTTKLLTRLRGLMKDRNVLVNGEHLEAYIIPSSDSHGNEYLNEKDKRRAFISKFTGSTGTAVVTDRHALLWTDGRYYLQASQQLDSNWTLMKDGLSGTPSIGDWIVRNIPPNSLVGIDTTLYGENLFQTLANKLRENSCELVDTKQNLVDIVRDECEKTEFEMESLVKLDVANTGLSTREKLKEIRSYMESMNLSSMVVSSMDEIAWLLNIRGRDIPFGTVFFSYCIITIDSCKLFTNLSRLEQTYDGTNSFKSYLLGEDNFEFYEYDQFLTYLNSHIQEEFVQKYKDDSTSKKIFLCSSSSHAIHALAPLQFVHKDISFLTKQRIIKNPSEIESARRIHIRDSLVLVEFFHNIQSFDFTRTDYFDFEVNEFNLGKYLDDMRLATDGCMSPSFETICSSGANGAIIHYKANSSSCNMVEKDNILLVDSGGHYLDMGTTDVTRTVFLGDTSKITAFQKECFTRVLKGHIQLAMRVFPAGTKPEFLDSFARQALWEGGLDYRHGTGHGVGALLNVHEVPIIANRKSIEIGVEENMIITIEPGYYEDGHFGIRIENCNLVVHANTNNLYAKNVNFVKFEPLTFVPIQREFIDVNILTQEEKNWLNSYHKRCADIIGSELLKVNKLKVHEWLMQQTKPL